MAEESAAVLVRGSPPAEGEGLSADAFRGLAMTFKDARVQHAADVEATAVTQRRERVKALIDQHIDDTNGGSYCTKRVRALNVARRNTCCSAFQASYARTVRAQSTIRQILTGRRLFRAKRWSFMLAGAIN